MKTKSIVKLMGLMVVIGCIGTYQFIEYHNNKIDQDYVQKKLSYEEVHQPTFRKIQALIAQQKSQNADASFVRNLENAMIDLKVTKEVYSHGLNNMTKSTPAYPLLLLWGAISAFLFMLVRVNERKVKALKNYYEKILDQLEISYSQDLSKDKNEIEVKEANIKPVDLST